MQKAPLIFMKKKLVKNIEKISKTEKKLRPAQKFMKMNKR